MLKGDSTVICTGFWSFAYPRLGFEAVGLSSYQQAHKKEVSCKKL